MSAPEPDRVGTAYERVVSAIDAALSTPDLPDHDRGRFTRARAAMLSQIDVPVVRTMTPAERRGDPSTLALAAIRDAIDDNMDAIDELSPWHAVLRRLARQLATGDAP